MKNIEEIYQELLAAFAERAGFTPEEGCDLAVRLWAAAAQLQALGIQADWVLDQSFPAVSIWTIMALCEVCPALRRQRLWGHCAFLWR